MPATTPKFKGAIAGRHLGRKPATDEMRARALPLRNFVKLAARPVPPTDDYASKAQDALAKMMDNDREQCCVATALAKALGIMNAYRPGGSVLVATDAEVGKFYHQVGGPGDNGLYMPDAFNFAITNGFRIGGTVHKLDGFASIDNSDSALLDAAHHWFGGVQIGVNLTERQYNNAADGDVWTEDGSPVVGGHAVPLTQRTPSLFKLATWAMQPSVSRACVQSRSWCDECYVLFGPDWFSAAHLDTNNVNVDALRAALDAIRNGGTPDIPADPNPPTPPTPPTPPAGSLTAAGKLHTPMGDWALDVSGYIGAPNLPQPAAAPNLFDVLGVLAQLWSDARRRDWAAVASDVEQLLQLLGVAATQAALKQLADALNVRAELTVLDKSAPPA